MTYLEEIKDFLETHLTADWFKIKKEKFTSHGKYDNESNLIIEPVFESSDIYGEVEEELIIVGTEVIELPSIKYNFSNYCWMSYENLDAFYLQVYEAPKKIADGYGINLSIIKIIKDVLPKDSITQSYNLIQAAISTIDESIDDIANDLWYLKIKEDIELLKMMFTSSIRSKFNNIYEIDKIATADNRTYLDFKVNKSKLTGLISLLIQSNILDLDSSTNTDNGKYDFLEKHFRWTDKQGEKQLLTNLRIDLQKITTTDLSKRRTSGAFDVFEMIEAAAKDL